ncbi:MAG TPA: DUF5753 domain-containing protein [Propionibacteriaceae bacterium]|nr:DUF5753 domain-containing protein [Propionibacteriaceae bacterium]
MSGIETGQVRVTLRDVRELLDLYNVQGQERDAVVEVAQQARVRAWWQEYGDAPGIPMVGLQAAAYARAVIVALYPDLDDDQVERRVQLRMARQSRMAEDDPPTFTAVLDEAVLQRRIGTAEAGLEQLLHLAAAADRPTVTLQILPFSAGAHAGLIGPFTIFRLPEDTDPDVVFLEQITRDLYLETAAELRQYSDAFERLRSQALSPRESVERIRSLAAKLAPEK